MFVLGSLITSLVLAVSLILAAAVAGLMAYHYAKARILERKGYLYDPTTETVETDNAGMEQRAKSAEEIAQIRERIETLMEHQQMATETQNQHLGQKLDEIRTHMGQQDMKMDGLKSELRHEIRHRDSELGELRQQLAAALDSFWKTMPALAAAGEPDEVRALPPAEMAEDDFVASAVQAEGVASSTDEAPAEPAAEPEHLYATADEMERVSSAQFGPDEAVFSPIEMEQIPIASSEAEPVELARFESESASFSYDEPEEAVFTPIAPPLPAFAPIEPTPHPFSAIEPEAAFTAPLDPMTTTFAPIKPDAPAPAETEPIEDRSLEPVAFAPVELEPVVSAPIDPEPNPFVPTEPEPATFVSIESVGTQLPPSTPEAASSSELKHDSFAPIVPESVMFPFSEPTPSEPAPAAVSTFALEPAEVEDVEPASATFTPFELAQIPVDDTVQPDEEPIAPIRSDPYPEPALPTFAPVSFAPVDDRTAPGPEERLNFAYDPAPLSSGDSVPDLPPFTPVNVAHEAISFTPDLERFNTSPSEPQPHEMTDLEPSSAAFASVEPGEAEIERPEWTAAGSEAFTLPEARERATPTNFETEEIQPEAPNTQPGTPEELVQTSASPWIDQPPPDPHTASTHADEMNVSANDQALDPDQTASFVNHVVVSPSGDSISMHPAEDTHPASPAPAQAPRSVLDAGSLYTGDSKFDPPGEPFDAEPVAEQAPEPRPNPGLNAAAESAAESESTREDRPPVAPENAPANPEQQRDDFTIISSISGEIQQRLYDIGVTKLDEMARWSRADARRVAGRVDISEETIMNQWIFEAQSSLFDRFQDKMAARQTASRQTS